MIYLDHAATAPMRPDSAAAMEPWLKEQFANPSASYGIGYKAGGAVERARREMAALVGAKPEEIIFTSGGTESDNQALLGTMLSHPKGHLIVSAIEHPAVLQTARRLEQFGFSLTILPVTGDGVVDAAAAQRAIRKETVLLSVMTVNNETGIVQPVEELAAMAKNHGILFHTDAVQAMGKLPFHLKDTDISLLSAGAHKFGGPKGIGFLYRKKNTPLAPLLTGGGQEDGMRSGTVSPALVCGMSTALRDALLNREAESERLRMLEQSFRAILHERCPQVRIYEEESKADHLPGYLSVSFPGREAEALLIALDRAGICASGGSACSSAERKPSYVLKACGLSEERIRGTLRFTLGAENTVEELIETASVLQKALQ